MRAPEWARIVVVLALAAVPFAASAPASAADTYTFGPSGLDGAGFQNVVAWSPFQDAAGNRPLLLGADVAGIHRSVDGGRHWDPSDVGLSDPHVAALLFSDTVPGKVYAATDRGLDVSTDFGQTWAPRSHAVTFDGSGVYELKPGQEHPRSTGNLLALDDSGPTAYLYAATATGGVKRSSDDGATWDHVALTGDHLRSIALDPTDPDRLYVGDVERGLEVSSDARAAMTFAPARGGPAVPEELAFVGPHLYVAGGSDGIFRFDGTWHPLDAGLPAGPSWESITGYRDPDTGQDVLYAGCAEPVAGNHTVRSDDGGATWTSASTGPDVTVSQQEYGQTTDWWAADKPYLGFSKSNFVTSDIVVDPDDLDTVVIAGRGGAYVATRTASGTTWWPAMDGLMTTVNMVVVADPQLSGRIYVGNMDWTFIASTDSGRTFLGDLVPHGAPTTGDAIALDPDGPPGSPSTVYLAASARGQSTGVGTIYSNPDPVAAPAGWTDEKLPVSNDVLALGVGHAANGARVVLASVTNRGLYREVGSSWSKVTGTAPFGSGSTGTFAWNRGSATVYAVDGAGVWRSTAAGATGSWAKLAPAAARYGDVNSLVADPVHPGVLYASDKKLGGIARITGADSGSPTRTTILPLTDPGPLAIDAAGRLFVHDRTGRRLLFSPDAASASPTFTDLGDDFYAANDEGIRSLAVGPDDTLFTASNSAGVSVGRPPAGGLPAPPPPPPDTGPPTMPGGLTGRVVSPTSVVLGWRASIDDVRVAGYRVSRDGTSLGTTTGLGWTDSAPGAGTHTYAVSAFDAAGNFSDPATASVVVPSPALSGMTGTYFDTATLTVQKLVRIDRTVNFSWGTGSPARGIGADSFSVRWTGEVLPTADGSWTFYTRSDDGVRLWIDGKPVIDHWTTHALQEDRGTIPLTASRAHTVQLEYADRTGSATIKLLWSGPGTAKQVIPAARLLAG